jgi:hypothetical protein
MAYMPTIPLCRRTSHQVPEPLFVKLPKIVAAPLELEQGSMTDNTTQSDITDGIENFRQFPGWEELLAIRFDVHQDRPAQLPEYFPDFLISKVHLPINGDTVLSAKLETLKRYLQRLYIPIGAQIVQHQTTSTPDTLEVHAYLIGWAPLVSEISHSIPAGRPQRLSLFLFTHMTEIEA